MLSALFPTSNLSLEIQLETQLDKIQIETQLKDGICPVPNLNLFSRNTIPCKLLNSIESIWYQLVPECWDEPFKGMAHNHEDEGGGDQVGQLACSRSEKSSGLRLAKICNYLCDFNCFHHTERAKITLSNWSNMLVIVFQDSHIFPFLHLLLTTNS